MSPHSRMNEWGSKETFRTSWKMTCCPIWCSMTRRNLTLSSTSTIKTTVFGVEMHRGRQESESTPESNLCYGLSGRYSHWKVFLVFMPSRVNFFLPGWMLGIQVFSWGWGLTGSQSSYSSITSLLFYKFHYLKFQGKIRSFSVCFFLEVYDATGFHRISLEALGAYFLT